MNYDLISSAFKVSISSALIISLPQPILASETAVQATFNNYRIAILNQDADSAYEAIANDTKTYYTDMLQHTLESDAATVEALPILDQLIILRSRHQIPAEELVAMDGASYFKYAVNRGWIDSSSVKQVEITDISIVGNTATSKITKNGQVAPFGFKFYQELDGWKIDLTSILNISEGAMQKLIQESGMGQTEFLLFLVESVSGTQVQDSIWQPLI